MAEPDVAGGGRFSASTTSTTKGLFGRQKSQTTQFSGFGVEIPGVKQLASDLHSVDSALTRLRSTLQSMSSSFTAGPLVNALSQISRAATTTQQSLNGLSTTVAGVGGGGGRPSSGGQRFSVPSSGAGNSTSANAGIAQQMSQNAGSYNTQSGQLGSAGAGMASAIGGAINGATSGLINSIPVIGPIAGGIMNFAGDMAMMPLRFARERIQTNRNAALKMAQELTPYQWQTGKDTSDLMWSLKNIPGGMKGDVADILGALGEGRGAGAMYGFGQQGGRYANNFYSNIGQFQQIAPGIGAGQMSRILSQSLGTKTNQMGAFYTGGAFSMVKAGGGGMKSASEWAEGIYKWLDNQQPGSKRGKGFSYGDLLAQNFPGSNINAWFETVGVSDAMRDFWWSWALAKSKMNVSGDKVFEQMGSDNGRLESNQAWRRAAAVTATTRNEFGLAGQMTGQYATREAANTWYNKAMGAAVNRIVPAMARSSLLGSVQYLPDEVENFLWNTLESSGPFGQIIGGGMMGWGSLMEGLTGQGFGTAGDIGDYGDMGGTSTAGLHPDLKKKVGAMMRANPRLKVTSGLRDKYTSAKLQRKGIGHFGSGVAYMGDVGDGRRKTNRNGVHSGGWAADLGPRSEYGWIQKNAHKFGLQTGSKHGEPWHVQNAGTIGDPGGDVGDWNDWIPGSGVVGQVWDTATGALDGIQMIAKLLGGLFSAFDKIKGMATGGILDPASYKGSPSSVVQTQSTAFMKLLGLNNASGLQADQRIGYDSGFGSGLSTNISFAAGPAGGGMATGGGTGGGGAGTVGSASVNRILQKYAGGNSVQAIAPDEATKQRMRTALQAAAAAGFSGDELVTIVSLAGRESRFNPQAYNGNLGTGDNSYGLWQINTLNGMWDRMKGPLGLTSKDQLKDPMINAKAAKYLFDQSNTPFFAWGPYRGDAPLHGGAEDWVPAVYSVAKESGMVGDIGLEYQAAGGGGTVRNTVLHFNNQFHIQGGSTQGGLDIGRIVPIMADRLEEEMRKRMAVRS